MLKRREGHIVTVASAAGLLGVPGLVDYCSSKVGGRAQTERLCWNRGLFRRVRCPDCVDPAQFGAVGFHEALRAELHRLNATCA